MAYLAVMHVGARRGEKKWTAVRGKSYQGFPAAVTTASRGMEHPLPAC